MSESPAKIKKERVWELDFIRGFCVLLMVFDHFMYDIAGIYGKAWYEYAVETGASNAQFLYDFWQSARNYFFYSGLRGVVEPLVVIVFCIVCGISCSFSKNNLKRGIEVLICAILIFAVTSFLGEDMTIRFGVFQMFSVAILSWCIIYYSCKKDMKKTAVIAGIIGLIMVIINYILMSIYNNNNQAFATDSNWYFIGQFMVGGSKSLPTADYQPIFPYVGFMFIGSALGPFLYKNKKSLMPWLGKYDWHAPISLWGKIALWVYISHQIVIAVLLSIISYLFLCPGSFVII